MLNYFRSSLQSKVLVILIAFSVFPFTFVGIFVYHYSYNTTKKNFIEYTQNYLKEMSNNVDSSLKNLEMLSTMLINDRNVISVLKADNDFENTQNEIDSIKKHLSMQQVFTNISTIRTDIWAISVYTDLNIYYYFRDPYTIDVLYRTKYRNDNWYKSAMSNYGETLLLSTHTPFQLSQSDVNVVSVARAVFDASTKCCIGVILIDSDLESFNGILNSSNESKDNSWIIIVDEIGNIVYSTEKDKTLQKSDLQSIKHNDFQGSYYMDFKGKKLLVNYVTSEYSKWKIVQFIPSEYVTRSSSVMGVVYLSVAFIILLLVLFMSFITSKSISKPIIELNKVLQQIGKGNLKDDVHSNRADEIGQLTRGIDEMRINLSELIVRISKAQLKQKEAELKSLQNQINPHFLYNTLNSIMMMAKLTGEEGIAQMVEDLGMIFKLSINKGQDLIPFQDELTHVNLYIKIQTMRYGNKINFDTDINDKILKLYTLKLSLQPIIENAIYHGIEKKSGIGRITIKGRISNQKVEILIEDDGVGIDNIKLTAIKKALKNEAEYDPTMMNIGIKNVHDRLKLYFGEEYGLTIESQEDMGTSVLINLPIIQNPDEVSLKALFPTIY